MGDGCNMEGISSEAASLAGHWGLGKLVVLYDDNEISIDGNTDISFTEDVPARYLSQGWHVQIVENGNTDLEGIRKALATAKSVTDKPSLVVVRTIIGYGSPNKVRGAMSCGGVLCAEPAVVRSMPPLTQRFLLHARPTATTCTARRWVPRRRPRRARTSSGTMRRLRCPTTSTPSSARPAPRARRRRTRGTPSWPRCGGAPAVHGWVCLEARGGFFCVTNGCAGRVR